MGLFELKERESQLYRHYNTAGDFGDDGKVVDDQRCIADK